MHFLFFSIHFINFTGGSDHGPRKKKIKSEGENCTEKTGKNKTKVPQKAKKAKRSSTEELVDLQKQQLDVLQKSETRFQEFMEKMMSEQKRMEEVERERDRDTLLKICEMFTKNDR